MTTTIYLSIIAVLVLFIIISALRRAYIDGLMFKQIEECLEEAKELNQNSEFTEDKKKTAEYMAEYMAAATDFKAPPRAKKQNQAPDTKKPLTIAPPLPLLHPSRIEEYESDDDFENPTLADFLSDKQRAKLGVKK